MSPAKLLGGRLWSRFTFLVGGREQLYLRSETGEEVLQEEQGILQTKTIAADAKVIPEM